MGTGKVHTGFWWGDLRQGDNFEVLQVDRRIILKWIFMTSHGETLTGLICFGIGTGGGLL
jgi:hypothetical protein